MQVGHRFASTTALYTGVSGDYKNEAMSRALHAQLAGRSREGRDERDRLRVDAPAAAGRARCSTATRSSRRCWPSTACSLSESQVWRIFTGKPERLNLHTLMVLCRILDCTPNDLIKPVERPARAASRARAAGGKGVGDLKPKRARIRPSEERGERAQARTLRRADRGVFWLWSRAPLPPREDRHPDLQHVPAQGRPRGCRPSRCARPAANSRPCVARRQRAPDVPVVRAPAPLSPGAVRVLRQAARSSPRAPSAGPECSGCRHDGCSSKIALPRL